MTEWHLPPGYIIENWTDELLSLMCEKLADRKQREIEAVQKHSAGLGRRSKAVSIKELLARGSNMIKVVKDAN